MTQSWIHTNRKTRVTAAAIRMRFSERLATAGLCPGFENSDYQPKPNGLDRLGRKI
jgi:hypothetical protein